MKSSRILYLTGTGIIIVGMFLFMILGTGNVMSNSMAIGVLVGMALFVGWIYLTNMRTMEKAVLGLIRARKRIVDLNVQDADIWGQLREEYKLFENRTLDGEFNLYRKEMMRLEKSEGISYKCEITDYINEEVIYAKGKKELLEFCPKVVGLIGILGALAGLVQGLKQVEDITSEIIPVLTMKLALEGNLIYLPLFGFILYLTMNLGIKGYLLQVHNESMYFLNDYHKYVFPPSANELANDMLYMQKSLVDSMDRFADLIGTQMANSIKEVTLPAFENIGKDMNQMVRDLNISQKEGMEDIVNHFVTQMNFSLGNQFTAWGDTIRQLCKWQKDTALNTQRVIDDMVSSSSDIRQIKETASGIVTEMDQYFHNVRALQEDVMVLLEDVKGYEGLFGQITDKQMDALESYNTHEEDMLRIIGDLNNETKELGMVFAAHAKEYTQASFEQKEAMNQVYADFIEKFKLVSDAQMEKSKEIGDQIKGNLDMSANTLKEISSKYHLDVSDAINRTFEQFDQNLSDIAKHLSGTVLDINEITLNIPKALNNSFHQMQTQLAGYVEGIESMRKVAVSLAEDMVRNPLESDLVKKYEEKMAEPQPKKRGRKAKASDSADKNVSAANKRVNKTSEEPENKDDISALPVEKATDSSINTEKVEDILSEHVLTKEAETKADKKPGVAS